MLPKKFNAGGLADFFSVRQGPVSFLEHFPLHLKEYLSYTPMIHFKMQNQKHRLTMLVGLLCTVKFLCKTNLKQELYNFYYNEKRKDLKIVCK